MQFELDPKNPNCMQVVMSQQERDIFNNAVLKALTNLALDTSQSLSADKLLLDLRGLLQARSFNSLSLENFSPACLARAAECIHDYQRDAAEDVVVEVGELATQFSDAARFLNDVNKTRMSPELIEAEVNTASIPDDLSDLF